MLTFRSINPCAWILACLLSLPFTLHAAGLFDGLINAAKGKTSAENTSPYSFSGTPAEQADKFVEVIRGSNFKNVKKVGIVNFSVEFTLLKEASAAGGRAGQGSTTVSVTRQIPTPDVAQLQKLTDTLYCQVQNDFKAMGIEVVPFERLQATKNFAELKPAQHASPWVASTRDTQSVFVAPTGMPLYMDNPERANFIQGLGFSFGTNTRMKEVMMTYDLNQEVHLLSVNMVVDFATVNSSGNSLSTYGARVGSADVHHLHAGNTSYRFISTTQPELLYVKLKQPLVSDKGLWSNESESTERSTSMVGEATKKTEVTGTFDAATYYSRSMDMLNAARQMFAASLAKARQ